MIYMMSSQDEDVPLLAQTVAGNSSDKKLFKERLKALKEQIQQGHEEYIVADSELYTKETLRDISEKSRQDRSTWKGDVFVFIGLYYCSKVSS